MQCTSKDLALTIAKTSFPIAPGGIDGAAGHGNSDRQQGKFGMLVHVTSPEGCRVLHGGEATQEHLAAA